ncbi:MAG: NADPH-dependent assimilatory sulfite reductase hemoprotein subunit [Opitutaceae bacterium]
MSSTATPAATPESVVKPLAKNEGLKAASNFLRGNILRDLADQSTGSITEDSGQLTKFHGIYGQDDRDLRNQRRKENKEKAFSFMARIRVPGGVCTPGQWLALDRLADDFTGGTLKLTTRQAFQFHGILKGDLWRTINGVNKALLDTIAACGDVNRNVMCNPNPEQSELHTEVYQVTKAISEHLLPRSRAYHELWVGDELVAGGEPESEPIYGNTYLPRKFKIVVAVPPSNDVDIYGNDLGFIAITDAAGKLAGFNVTVGGGLGMSHNQIETFPRIADVMGFCTVKQAVEVAEKVVLVQRDYGDRTDRKHARLKYTIEDRGLPWFRHEVEARLGYRLGAPRHFNFTHTGDRYGWVDSHDGRSHFTLYIMSGRVRDDANYKLKTALREIALAHKGDFRLTANQNLIIANVAPADRPQIEALLRKHKLDTANDASGLKLNAMSCVALPTCGLALAESERYLPDLVEALEAEFEAAGLRHDEVTLRITGCPNGCGRPYLAEIGFVGKSPGKYNIYLGAAFNGSRLNILYKANTPIAEIVPLLGPIIKRYALERTTGERFGDFVIRAGYVKTTHTAQDFHEAKAAKPAVAEPV